MFHVGTVEIGDNVLVGNNSCFPINSSVPSDTTIAVNTVAPPEGAAPGGVWVGNPPTRITDNIVVPFTPGSRIDQTLMLTSEVMIIFIPGTLWACTILTWLYLFVYLVFTLDVISDNPIWQTAFGAMLLIPLRAIWAIIGGFIVRVIQSGFTRTPEEKNVGYWDSLCYRWRIYNKVWAFFVIPMLLDDFSGCMWMNRIVNFLTMAEIEEDVLIVHHGLFKDHDYIKVRKGATINESAILRTHTFEDWRLKLSFVEIGPNNVVHPCSTIMFGAETGENCTVVSNSLVLKGDKLAAGTITAGIPSVPVKNREPEGTADESLLIEVRPSRLHRNILIVSFLLLFLLVNVGVSAAVGTLVAKRNAAKYRASTQPLLTQPLSTEPAVEKNKSTPADPKMAPQDNQLVRANDNFFVKAQSVLPNLRGDTRYIYNEHQGPHNRSLRGHAPLH
jgi:carbonic anhydrase/acetyltransferase-like protein (isoleucine patch superfamily)